MKIMKVGGNGMLGAMSMWTSRRGRARTDTEWPSLCHWERYTGRGERTAREGWDGTSTSRGTDPARQMDPLIEQQLKAYLDDALTLTPLHLGEWHPPLQACGRCQHKDETTSSFRCTCQWERLWTAAWAATGHWRISDGEVLLVLSNLLGSRTCLGERGRGTHDWAVVSWGQHVALHVVAVLEFQRLAQVVRQVVDDL